VTDAEEELQKHKELERREVQRRRSDLRAVMGTATGRRFVWRLLNSDTGINSLSYTGDPSSTDFNEGRRSVGLNLLGEIQRDAPAAWMRTMQERAEQIARDQSERKRRPPGAAGPGEPDAHEPFAEATDDE
jgi:hypothetical protein